MAAVPAQIGQPAPCRSDTQTGRLTKRRGWHCGHEGWQPAEWWFPYDIPKCRIAREEPPGGGCLSARFHRRIIAMGFTVGQGSRFGSTARHVFRALVRDVDPAADG